MTQPTPFVRGFNFTDYQAQSPGTPLPGYRLDAELDHVADTLGGVLGNLALIQRDDGKLQDGVVTVDAVSAELLQAIAAEAPPGPQGDDGRSAFDVAVANGFVGTQAQWVASLKSTTPGNPGANAANPNFTFAVNTLAPGSNATLQVTGAYPNLLLTFGVPRGAAGAGGGGGALADLDYGDVNVTGTGTKMVVQTVLDGQTPSVSGHGHAIADVAGLQNALDGKASVASLNAKADSTAVAADLAEKLDVDSFVWANLDGKPLTFPPDAHDHDDRYYTDVEVDDLLAGKLGAGTPITIADVSGLQEGLAGKAGAFTAIKSWASSQNVNDADHNGCYNKMTGATNRTITFGSTPAAGHCSLWVNRATSGMLIACSGGYWKDGAQNQATATFNLPQGAKMTAFHEGGGNWTFEVV